MSDNPNRILYDLINDYRVANGLKRIPLSMKLMLVAIEHVKDLDTYHPEQNCNGNLHSWSTHGNWTGGCFDLNDSSTYNIMWNKPQEIAQYPSKGYEIAYSGGHTPESALASWKQPGGHNDVILNQGIFSSYTWKALGTAIQGGYACAWFGEGKDCFLATAAYGSPLANEVQFLRRYREVVVKKNRWGRTLLNVFERFYYSFSPRLASFIQRSEKLRYLARIFVVDPIVDLLLFGSLVFRTGRRLVSSQDTSNKHLAGTFIRGIGGWTYSVSWIIWNVLLACSCIMPEMFQNAVMIWIPLLSGLFLTRIGAWIHGDNAFNNIT